MYKFPQVLVNVNVKARKPINELPKTSKLIIKSEAKLGSSGRIYIRYSGTEGNKLRVMIEGQDQLLIKEMADNIAVTATQELDA